MTKYLNDGKVIECNGARFNVAFLKENTKRKVFDVLKHIDTDLLEEVFNKVNGIKADASDTATTSKTKSEKKKSSKKDDSKK